MLVMLVVAGLADDMLVVVVVVVKRDLLIVNGVKRICDGFEDPETCVVGADENIKGVTVAGDCGEFGKIERHNFEF